MALPLAALALGMQGAGNILGTVGNLMEIESGANALMTNAASVERSSKDKAKAIRRAGSAEIGRTNVALATSGFRFDDPTSMDIREQLAMDVESDALNEILSGKLQAAAMRVQAHDLRSSAGTVMASGALSTGATMLLGAGRLG